MELDQDNIILNNIKQHFLYLKKSTKQTNSKISFSKELILLLRFAQKSTNPKILLKNTGVILFTDICAFNTNSLSNYFSISRSQINRLLSSENWELIKVNVQKQKDQIKHVIPENELKNWTLRKYPIEGGVLKFAEANGITEFKNATQDFSNEIEAYFPSLSLQMDVISFTFDYQ